MEEERSWTALHWASHYGDLQKVESLLQDGANREAQSRSGKTPLHLAAARGHIGLLPLLITPTTLVATDSSHHTPLHCAIRAHQAEAVAVLVAAGAAPHGPHPGPESNWAPTRTPIGLAIDCLLSNRDLAPQLAQQLGDAVVALNTPGIPVGTAGGLTSSFHTAAAAGGGRPDLVAEPPQAALVHDAARRKGLPQYAKLPAGWRS
jgi:ankyrin repeat protein